MPSVAAALSPLYLLARMKTLDRLTVATRMPPKTPPAGYVLEPLRKGSDFTLYRGYEQGNPSPILAVTITAEQPPPQSLKQLEHEYALRDTLDPDWAAQPLALVARNGRMTLVLADPGGELLDRLLGQPLAVTEFMRIGIPLVRALRRAHESGLIHKDIKPANVLMDMESGCAWLT